MPPNLRESPGSSRCVSCPMPTRILLVVQTPKECESSPNYRVILAKLQKTDKPSACDPSRPSGSKPDAFPHFCNDSPFRRNLSSADRLPPPHAPRDRNRRRSRPQPYFSSRGKIQCLEVSCVGCSVPIAPLRRDGGRYSVSQS